MGFARVINIIVPLVAIFLLKPLSATSPDFLSPFISPIFDDVCKEVECGKGTCKPSKNNTFFFECVCDPGWNQSIISAPSIDDSGLKFLPCIVPNCTMNNSCSKAPSPAQQTARQANESVFDACHWVDCGGGSCNKTSTFTYNCDCDVGYSNLLNLTAMPCYKECDVGMGCSDLGISMTNTSTSPPPPALNDDSNNNKGSSIVQGSYLRLTMLIMTMTEIQLQYNN